MQFEKKKEIKKQFANLFYTFRYIHPVKCHRLQFKNKLYAKKNHAVYSISPCKRQQVENPDRSRFTYFSCA